MNKSYFSNFAIASLWVSSALAILIRVYSLRFNPPENPILFWLPYIILIFISAMIVLTKKGLLPLFATLGVALILHMLNFVREPEGLIWSTDSSHNLQVAISIVETGHLAMGDPSFSSIALDSSYYPGAELFASSLHMITGIPLMTLYKGAFAILNVITLLSLFILMRAIVEDQRTVNLCIFLYALCPGFSGFGSFGVHESLGIIFYPLMMSVFLVNMFTRTHKFRSRKVFTVLFIFMLLVTITHHFTMYMLVFSAFLITIGTYTFKRKTYIPQTRILVLLVVLIVGWLSFVAFYFVKVHGEVTIHMIRSILLVSEYQASSGGLVYSLSPFARFVSYAGVGLFLLTSLMGAYLVGWGKEKTHITNAETTALMVWWAISVALIGLFEIAQLPGARYRVTEFAYFGIVLFSAIGIKKLSTRLGYLNKAITICILIIIAVPTIYVGFTQQGYLCYDSPPPITIDTVYPVESYFSSIWLKNYSESDYVLGTSDAFVYVSAYASKKHEYSLFISSIEHRQTPSYICYVNRANLILPDPSNFTIKTEDFVWLTSNLNIIYENGIIDLMLAPKTP